jgi:salicylate hydroxylase
MAGSKRTVIVAGGGIAGLTAALALADRGFRVDIFEQAEGFDAVGAGLQLSPNAFHILDRLGLGRAIKAAAVGPNAIRIMSAQSGRQIAQVPLGAESIERYGAPYLVTHRADLQMALAGAANSHPDISLHLGQQIEDAAPHANGVTALAYGDGRLEEHTGVALVCADGVWSRLRKRHFSAEAPVFSGMVAWRGLIPTENMPGTQDLENVQLWLAPKAHAVSYPVRGGRYLNIVVITPFDGTSGEHPGQGWANDADASDLARHLEGWNKPFIDLAARRMRWTQWPLFAAPRLSTWVEGPMALIGDAAHAMLPFAAQGAVMAIEDAAVLAQCLERTVSENLDAAVALDAYQLLRRPRVARAARLARANRAIYHLPPPLSQARNLAMAALGGRRLLARQDWLYDWRLAEL